MTYCVVAVHNLAFGEMAYCGRCLPGEEPFARVPSNPVPSQNTRSVLETSVILVASESEGLWKGESNEYFIVTENAPYKYSRTVSDVHHPCFGMIRHRRNGDLVGAQKNGGMQGPTL